MIGTIIGNGSWYIGGPSGLPSSPNAPTITSPAFLVSGSVGTIYPTTTFTATGPGPITWSITSGALPSGLTFSSSGILSGTPTVSNIASLITFMASNSFGSANTTLALTVNDVVTTPTLTSLSSYGNIVSTTDFTLTATGTFQSGDQIELWNTLLATTYVNSTTLTATVTTAKMASRNFGCVRIARGTERSYPLPFEAYDTATYPSNYVTNASSIIGLTYGTAPAKGEVRTLTTTGNQVVRQTSIADSNGGGGLYGTTNFTNTYATFSSQNCNGTHFIADTELSYASDLYRKSDRVNLGAIRRGVVSGTGDLLGEVHELRWDTLGDRPNVVYYVKGMALYERDIVSGSAEVLIKDFTSDFPNVAAGSYILCDVEGIPSIDCRYWAFMLRHPYIDATTYQGIYCFIWYDKLKNTFTTAANTVFGVTKRFNSGATFYRPNMCSMSLRGDKFITHYGRVYPSGDTGRESEFGTATDQPRAWSASFTNPKIISIDETHGSQAFDSSMNQTWVSQCNAGYDSVEWTDISVGGTYRQAGATLASQNMYTSPTSGTGRTQLINQATDGYGGYHVSTCMSGVRRGFVSISGYNSESPATIGAQQFRIYRLSDAKVWRVGHKPGTYPASDAYRNEAQVAVSHDFTELMCGGNWNGSLTPSGHREYFITYLPRDWHTNAIWSLPSSSSWEALILGASSTYDPTLITTGTVKYVAKSGNDTTGDGTSGNPYLTITKAASVISAGAGGVIYVKAGTYSEAVTLPAGASGNTLKLRRYPGDAVTMSGGGSLANAVTLSGGYVEIHGITFTDYTSRAITSSTAGTSYTFQYLTVTNTAGLSKLAAGSIGISKLNIVYSSGTAATPVAAIDLSAGGCSAITADLIKLTGSGADSSSPASGISIATAGATTLTRCLVTNFSGIAADLNVTTGNLVAQNNKLTQTAAAGLGLLKINVGTGYTGTFENNLIYRTADNTFGEDVVSIATGTGSVIIRRNTIWNGSIPYCYTINDQVGGNLKLQANLIIQDPLNGHPVVTSVGKPAASQANNWRYNDFYAPGAITNAINFDDTANAGASAAVYTLVKVIDGTFNSGLSSVGMVGNFAAMPALNDFNGLDFRLDISDTICANKYIDNVLTQSIDQDGNNATVNTYMDVGCFERQT